MSYAVTDAVENDFTKQIAKLRTILDDLDQLAATAQEIEDLAPDFLNALLATYKKGQQTLREVESL